MLGVFSTPLRYIYLADDFNVLQRSLRRLGYRTIEFYEAAPGVPLPTVPGLTDAHVRQAALYTACIELECHPTELDPGDAAQAAVLARCDAEARRLICRLHQLYTNEPWDVALVFQGYLPFDAAVRTHATLMGVPMAGLELTANRERLAWDFFSGCSVNPPVARAFFKAAHLLANDRAAVDYCDRLFARIRDTKRDEHISGAGTPPRAPGKPRLLFIGQVYTDASQLFWDIDARGPLDLYRCVLELAAGGAFDVVLKLHPKEMRGGDPVHFRPFRQLTLRKLQAALPPHLLSAPNVHIDADNRFDTYALMREADLVLTANSQAGMEAAALGRAVLCGRGAFYGGLGFTHDYQDVSTLRAQLDRWQAEGLPAPDPAAARRFLHLFYERYCIRREPDAIARAVQMARQFHASHRPLTGGA